MEELGGETRKLYRLKAQLKHLEDRRYLKMVEHGHALDIILGDRGVEELLKKAILKREDILPDGLLCYVSFDIPESSRFARQSLRMLLKQAGFRMIHKSVWCSTKDVGEELAEFVRLLGVEKHVHVIEGRYLTSQYTQIDDPFQEKIERQRKKISRVEERRTYLRDLGCRISLK